MSKHTTPAQNDTAAEAQGADPALQGEGNYTAARRYRKGVEKFVDAGKVPAAAEKAEPKNEQEAQELLQAEAAGREPARR